MGNSFDFFGRFCILLCVFRFSLTLRSGTSRDSITFNESDGYVFCDGTSTTDSKEKISNCLPCGRNITSENSILIQNYVKLGEVINVKLKLNSTRDGSFYFRMCELSNLASCGSEAKLFILDSNNSVYQLTGDSISFRLRLQIPTNLTEGHFILQWNFQSGSEHIVDCASVLILLQPDITEADLFKENTEIVNSNIKDTFDSTGFVSQQNRKNNTHLSFESYIRELSMENQTLSLKSNSSQNNTIKEGSSELLSSVTDETTQKPNKNIIDANVAVVLNTVNKKHKVDENVSMYNSTENNSRSGIANDNLTSEASTPSNDQNVGKLQSKNDTSYKQNVNLEYTSNDQNLLENNTTGIDTYENSSDILSKNRSPNNRNSAGIKSQPLQNTNNSIGTDATGSQSDFKQVYVHGMQDNIVFNKINLYGLAIPTTTESGINSILDKNEKKTHDIENYINAQFMQIVELSGQTTTGSEKVHKQGIDMSSKDLMEVFLHSDNPNTLIKQPTNQTLHAKDQNIESLQTNGDLGKRPSLSWLSGKTPTMEYTDPIKSNNFSDIQLENYGFLRPALAFAENVGNVKVKKIKKKKSKRKKSKRKEKKSNKPDKKSKSKKSNSKDKKKSEKSKYGKKNNKKDKSKGKNGDTKDSNVNSLYKEMSEKHFKDSFRIDVKNAFSDVKTQGDIKENNNSVNAIKQRGHKEKSFESLLGINIQTNGTNIIQKDQINDILSKKELVRSDKMTKQNKIGKVDESRVKSVTNNILPDYFVQESPELYKTRKNLIRENQSKTPTNKFANTIIEDLFDHGFNEKQYPEITSGPFPFEKKSKMTGVQGQVQSKKNKLRGESKKKKLRGGFVNDDFSLMVSSPIMSLLSQTNEDDVSLFQNTLKPSVLPEIEKRPPTPEPDILQRLMEMGFIEREAVPVVMENTKNTWNEIVKTSETENQEILPNQKDEKNVTIANNSNQRIEHLNNKGKTEDVATKSNFLQNKQHKSGGDKSKQISKNQTMNIDINSTDDLKLNKKKPGPKKKRKQKKKETKIKERKNVDNTGESVITSDKKNVDKESKDKTTKTNTRNISRIKTTQELKLAKYNQKNVNLKKRKIVSQDEMEINSVKNATKAETVENVKIDKKAKKKGKKNSTKSKKKHEKNKAESADKTNKKTKGKSVQKSKSSNKSLKKVKSKQIKSQQTEKRNITSQVENNVDKTSKNNQIKSTTLAKKEKKKKARIDKTSKIGLEKIMGNLISSTTESGNITVNKKENGIQKDVPTELSHLDELDFIIPKLPYVYSKHSENDINHNYIDNELKNHVQIWEDLDNFSENPTSKSINQNRQNDDQYEIIIINEDAAPTETNITLESDKTLTKEVQSSNAGKSQDKLISMYVGKKDISKERKPTIRKESAEDHVKIDRKVTGSKISKTKSKQSTAEKRQPKEKQKIETEPAEVSLKQLPKNVNKEFQSDLSISNTNANEENDGEKKSNKLAKHHKKETDMKAGTKVKTKGNTTIESTSQSIDGIMKENKGEHIGNLMNSKEYSRIVEKSDNVPDDKAIIEGKDNEDNSSKSRKVKTKKSKKILIESLDAEGNDKGIEDGNVETKTNFSENKIVKTQKEKSNSYKNIKTSSKTKNKKSKPKHKVTKESKRKVEKKKNTKVAHHNTGKRNETNTEKSAYQRNDQTTDSKAEKGNITAKYETTKISTTEGQYDEEKTGLIQSIGQKTKTSMKKSINVSDKNRIDMKGNEQTSVKKITDEKTHMNSERKKAKNTNLKAENPNKSTGKNKDDKSSITNTEKTNNRKSTTIVINESDAKSKISTGKVTNAKIVSSFKSHVGKTEKNKKKIHNGRKTSIQNKKIDKSVTTKTYNEKSITNTTIVDNYKPNILNMRISRIQKPYEKYQTLEISTVKPNDGNSIKSIITTNNENPKILKSSTGMPRDEKSTSLITDDENADVWNSTDTDINKVKDNSTISRKTIVEQSSKSTETEKGEKSGSLLSNIIKPNDEKSTKSTDVNDEKPISVKTKIGKPIDKKVKTNTENLREETKKTMKTDDEYPITSSTKSNDNKKLKSNKQENVAKTKARRKIKIIEESINGMITNDEGSMKSIMTTDTDINNVKDKHTLSGQSTKSTETEKGEKSESLLLNIVNPNDEKSTKSTDNDEKPISITSKFGKSIDKKLETNTETLREETTKTMKTDDEYKITTSTKSNDNKQLKSDIQEHVAKTKVRRKIKIIEESINGIIKDEESTKSIMTTDTDINNVKDKQTISGKTVVEQSTKSAETEKGEKAGSLLLNIIKPNDEKSKQITDNDEKPISITTKIGKTITGIKKDEQSTKIIMAPKDEKTGTAKTNNKPSNISLTNGKTEQLITKNLRIANDAITMPNFEKTNTEKTTTNFVTKQDEIKKTNIRITNNKKSKTNLGVADDEKTKTNIEMRKDQKTKTLTEITNNKKSKPIKSLLTIHNETTKTINGKEAHLENNIRIENGINGITDMSKHSNTGTVKENHEDDKTPIANRKNENFQTGLANMMNANEGDFKTGVVHTKSSTEKVRSKNLRTSIRNMMNVNVRNLKMETGSVNSENLNLKNSETYINTIIPGKDMAINKPGNREHVTTNINNSHEPNLPIAKLMYEQDNNISKTTSSIQKESNDIASEKEPSLLDSQSGLELRFNINIDNRGFETINETTSATTQTENELQDVNEQTNNKNNNAWKPVLNAIDNKYISNNLQGSNTLREQMTANQNAPRSSLGEIIKEMQKSSPLLRHNNQEISNTNNNGNKWKTTYISVGNTGIFKTRPEKGMTDKVRTISVGERFMPYSSVVKPSNVNKENISKHFDKTEENLVLDVKLESENDSAIPLAGNETTEKFTPLSSGSEANETPGVVIASDTSPVFSDVHWPALISTHLEWTDTALKLASLSSGFNTDGTYISNPYPKIDMHNDKVSTNKLWSAKGNKRIDMSNRDISSRKSTDFTEKDRIDGMVHMSIADHSVIKQNPQGNIITPTALGTQGSMFSDLDAPYREQLNKGEGNNFKLSHGLEPTVISKYGSHQLNNGGVSRSMHNSWDRHGSLGSLSSHGIDTYSNKGSVVESGLNTLVHRDSTLTRKTILNKGQIQPNKSPKTTKDLNDRTQNKKGQTDVFKEHQKGNHQRTLPTSTPIPLPNHNSNTGTFTKTFNWTKTNIEKQHAMNAGIRLFSVNRKQETSNTRHNKTELRSQKNYQITPKSHILNINQNTNNQGSLSPSVIKRLTPVSSRSEKENGRRNSNFVEGDTVLNDSLGLHFIHIRNNKATADNPMNLNQNFQRGLGEATTPHNEALTNTKTLNSNSDIANIQTSNSDKQVASFSEQGEKTVNSNWITPNINQSTPQRNLIHFLPPRKTINRVRRLRGKETSRQRNQKLDSNGQLSSSFVALNNFNKFRTSSHVGRRSVGLLDRNTGSFQSPNINQIRNQSVTVLDQEQQIRSKDKFSTLTTGQVNIYSINNSIIIDSNDVKDVSTACTSSERFTCNAVGSYSAQVGFGSWCVSNCKMGECLSDKCVCFCVSTTTNNLRKIVIKRNNHHPIKSKPDILSKNESQQHDIPLHTNGVKNSVKNSKPSSSGNVTCTGTKNFAAIKGIAKWCNRRCNNSVCPIFICKCKRTYQRVL